MSQDKRRLFGSRISSIFSYNDAHHHLKDSDRNCASSVSHTMRIPNASSQSIRGSAHQSHSAHSNSRSSISRDTQKSEEDLFEDEMQNHPPQKARIPEKRPAGAELIAQSKPSKEDNGVSTTNLNMHAKPNRKPPPLDVLHHGKYNKEPTRGSTTESGSVDPEDDSIEHVGKKFAQTAVFHENSHETFTRGRTLFEQARQIHNINANDDSVSCESDFGGSMLNPEDFDENEKKKSSSYGGIRSCEIDKLGQKQHPNASSLIENLQSSKTTSCSTSVIKADGHAQVNNNFKSSPVHAVLDNSSKVKYMSLENSNSEELISSPDPSVNSEENKRNKEALHTLDHDNQSSLSNSHSTNFSFTTKSQSKNSFSGSGSLRSDADQKFSSFYENDSDSSFPVERSLGTTSDCENMSKNQSMSEIDFADVTGSEPTFDSSSPLDHSNRYSFVEVNNEARQHLLRSQLPHSKGGSFLESTNLPAAQARPPMTHTRVSSMSSAHSVALNRHVSLATLKMTFSLRPGEGEKSHYVDTIRKSAGTSFNEAGPGRWKLPTGIMPIEARDIAQKSHKKFNRNVNNMGFKSKKSSGVELKHGHLQPRLLAAEVDEGDSTNKFGALGRSSTLQNKALSPVTSKSSTPSAGLNLISRTNSLERANTRASSSTTGDLQSSLGKLQSSRRESTVSLTGSIGSIANDRDVDIYYQHEGYKVEPDEISSDDSYHERSGQTSYYNYNHEDEKPRLYLANPDSD